jgi:Zn-dependent protease with chaperone function
MIVEIVISAVGLLLAILALRRQWLGSLWTWVSEKRFVKRSLLTRSAIYVFLWLIVGFFINLVSLNVMALSIPNTLSVIFMFAPVLAAVVLAKWGPRLGPMRMFLLGSGTIAVVAVYLSSINVWWTYNGMKPLKETFDSQPLFDLATNVGMPHENIKITTNAGFGSVALMTGLPGTEYIVVGNVDKDALEGIVAHELGHFVNRDIVTLVAVIIATHATYFALGSFVVWNDPSIFEAFGFTTEPMAGVLAIADFIANVFSNLVGAIENTIGRRAEYRADAFSAQHFDPQATSTFLLKSSVPFEHWLYEFLFKTHPCSGKRVEAMKRIWSSK